jgi:hypothetical protein
MWTFECSSWIDIGATAAADVAVAFAAALPPDLTHNTVPPAPAHIAQPRMMALSMATSFDQSLLFDLNELEIASDRHQLCDVGHMTMKKFERRNGAGVSAK